MTPGRLVAAEEVANGDLRKKKKVQWRGFDNHIKAHFQLLSEFLGLAVDDIDLGRFGPGSISFWP